MEGNLHYLMKGLKVLIVGLYKFFHFEKGKLSFITPTTISGVKVEVSTMTEWKAILDVSINAASIAINFSGLCITIMSSSETSWGATTIRCCNRFSLSSILAVNTKDESNLGCSGNKSNSTSRIRGVPLTV